MTHGCGPPRQKAFQKMHWTGTSTEPSCSTSVLGAAVHSTSVAMVSSTSAVNSMVPVARVQTTLIPKRFAMHIDRGLTDRPDRETEWDAKPLAFGGLWSPVLNIPHIKA